jgi:hypothetical protein
MLSEIKLVLSSLQDKLPTDPLVLDDLKRIFSLYKLADVHNKTYMSKELSNITGIALDEMNTLLESAQEDSTLSPHTISLALLQEQERFQVRIKRRVPGIQELSMSAEEWHELMTSLKGRRGALLTPYLIIFSLAKIKELSYPSLVSCLSKKTSPRASRPVFLSVTDWPLSFAKRRKCSEEKNPAIVSLSATSALSHGDLEATGARVIASPDPVTPKKGFSAVYQTPGKTLIRCTYENTEGSIYMPLSPEQLTPLRSSGMVRTAAAATAELLQQALPELSLARPGGVDFTATLPKMLARRHLSRRVSQNALMKASCRDVFSAHGVDTIITQCGSKYHWSHLIAHFLGGEQEKENLIPGTSASNYNTLEVVEQFVASKLINGDVLSVAIRVTPMFSREALIPDELRFDLAWDEAGHHFKETIRINPRSHRRESPATLATIGLFRGASRSLSFREGSSPTSSSTP